MKAFADLYAALDETTKTNEKVAALARYFAAAPPADAAWAVYFLIGRRPKRLPRIPQARAVGHRGGRRSRLALRRVLPRRRRPRRDHRAAPAARRRLHRTARCTTGSRSACCRCATADDETRRAWLVSAWREMDEPPALRLEQADHRRVPRRRLAEPRRPRARRRSAALAAEVIAHRLMGDWEPTPDFWRAARSPPKPRDADVSRPYPFFLAYPLEGRRRRPRRPRATGRPSGSGTASARSSSAAQWRTFLWSRGEELITDRFPELDAARRALPDGTVIDGEILPWKDGAPLPFAQLQRRIGRKALGPKILAEVPVVLIAYDLLELGGEDIRERPLRMAPRAAAKLVAPLATARLRALADRRRAAVVGRARAAPRAVAASARSRASCSSGSARPYRVGRRRGDWWKWKIDPYTVDAVLIYAQPGNGRRASLFTDYTFGVWDDGKLVPFAKAYSGLTDEEIREVDAFVRRNTIEKFGPVRTRQAGAGLRAGLRGHPALDRGTSPASPSASRACCAGGTTRSPKTPTPSIRSAASSRHNQIA